MVEHPLCFNAFASNADSIAKQAAHRKRLPHADREPLPPRGAAETFRARLAHAPTRPANCCFRLVLLSGGDGVAAAHRLGRKHDGRVGGHAALFKRSDHARDLCVGVAAGVRLLRRSPAVGVARMVDRVLVEEHQRRIPVERRDEIVRHRLVQRQVLRAKCSAWSFQFFWR